MGVIDITVLWGGVDYVPWLLSYIHSNGYVSAVCKTDEGHSCVFPFKYKGLVHEKCTLSQSSKAWCAYDIEVGTEVPVDGFHWGDCISSCPIEGLKVWIIFGIIIWKGASSLTSFSIEPNDVSSIGNVRIRASVK